MKNLNAVVVEEGVDSQAVGYYRLGVRNDKGERLVDFCNHYDMSITYTFQNIQDKYIRGKYLETLQDTKSTKYW
jgi:hypothetical protein